MSDCGDPEQDAAREREQWEEFWSMDDRLERIRAILAEHDEKYVNHRPGPGCSFEIEMLCLDTIAAIKLAIGDATV